MICAFIGCDRDAGDRWFCKTHQKQLARRKDPDLMTPIGVPVEDVPPCRKCGGTDFGIKVNRQRKRGLQRYCLPCARRYQMAWINRNRDRAREIRLKSRWNRIESVRKYDRERARLRRTSATTREEFFHMLNTSRSSTSTGSCRTRSALNSEPNSASARTRCVAQGF